MRRAALVILLCLFFVSACFASSVTVELTREQDAAIAALVAAKQSDTARVLAQVIVKGLLSEQQAQQQSSEAALLEAFRNLSPAEQLDLLKKQNVKQPVLP